jgi:hypothetical protein
MEVSIRVVVGIFLLLIVALVILTVLMGLSGDAYSNISGFIDWIKSMVGISQPLD